MALSWFVSNQYLQLMSRKSLLVGSFSWQPICNHGNIFFYTFLGCVVYFVLTKRTLDNSKDGSKSADLLRKMKIQNKEA